MKRIAGILLLMVYSVCAIGLSLHMHYCCGKLAGISIGTESKSCCPHEDTTSNCHLDHSCCSFGELSFKIEGGYQNEASLFLAHNFVLKPICAAIFPDFTEFTSLQKTWLQTPKPPDSTPVFLKYHSLVYYG
jgi:hypothetical protein